MQTLRASTQNRHAAHRRQHWSRPPASRLPSSLHLAARAREPARNRHRLGRSGRHARSGEGACNYCWPCLAQGLHRNRERLKLLHGACAACRSVAD
eukprot:scaffold113750_cov26-Tisochrysis_lutea.AAC.1